MVLKALEIQGFKSFPDRIRISIDRGITAVVGPNGSGKSNISDAIRWVLGETSSKQLRGAGKMEDVIFGGTQLRGAMGYASVKLTVDNTDRRIEVDSDEVTIGRRYYRSGESEYSINGQNVRLKDIYELFLDTGLGRDGYSIIGQGRIAEIVGAKSAERREIFEEASGIAKYRYRKNEAERRLCAAEDNLARLRDILDELEARVGPLERESKKAKQFLEYSARRRELEVTLWVDNVRRARETVRTEQRRYEAAAADYDRLSREIETIDAESETIRAAAQELTVQIERANAAIRAMTEEQAGADSQLAVLENDIGHNDAAIQKLKDELAASREGKAAIAAEIAGHEEAVRAAAGQAAGLEKAIAALEERLARLQAESLASGEKRGGITARLAELTQSQTAAQVEAARAASAAEAAEARLAAAKAEAEAGRQSLEALRAERAGTDEYLAGLQADLTRLANIQAGLEMKLESRQKQHKEADDAALAAARQEDAARQRLAVLEDLERNMEGYQQSVKSVMQAGRSGRLRGIIGPVSSILSVRPGYELAVETALGYALQNLVVENEAAAKAGIAFLKEQKAGRATFLPLDTVQGSSLDEARLPMGAVCAASLVSCEKRYQTVAANLLGRIVVVDNIDEAAHCARSLGYRNRVVTVDGQVVNAGGSFTGGSASRSAGFFSRRQEIAELKKKLARLAEERKKAEENAARWKSETDKLSAELTAVQSEAVTAGGDAIRAEMEAKRLASEAASAEAAAGALADECETLRKKIAAETENARSQAAAQQALAREIAGQEEELAALAGSDDSFLQLRGRLSDEMAARRMEKLSAEKDAELHTAAIASLQSRTGEDAARRAEAKRGLAELDALNEKNRARMDEIRAAKEGCAGRIAQKEEEIRAAAARRMEEEGAAAKQGQRLRAVTDEREKMSGEMARLTERRAAAETEYDQTIAKLWEEYQLTLTDAEGICVEFESAAGLRRQVQEVRGKIRALGNVNVGAIEEYEEVSARYTTLKEQVRDVEGSKAELLRMIGELSGEMRRLFTESFKAINSHFARIFRELFGGGSASLTLSDETDVLESGIEIQVSPPGKVIKNLAALSGGEQSLVAISIYFAILAVNPAPFCILDEIEAALDDVNVTRYAQYLRRITDHTQFIVITHRRGTMEAADVLYGVTMQEDGVSKLLRLDLDQVDASLVS